MLSGPLLDFDRLHKRPHSRKQVSYTTGSLQGDPILSREWTTRIYEFERSSFPSLPDVPVLIGDKRVAVAHLTLSDNSISFAAEWEPLKTLHSYRPEFEIVSAIPSSRLSVNCAQEVIYKVMEARLTAITFFADSRAQAVESLRVDDKPWFRYVDAVPPPRASLDSVQQTLERIEAKLTPTIGRKHVEFRG